MDNYLQATPARPHHNATANRRGADDSIKAQGTYRRNLIDAACYFVREEWFSVVVTSIVKTKVHFYD